MEGTERKYSVKDADLRLIKELISECRIATNVGNESSINALVQLSLRVGVCNNGLSKIEDIIDSILD